MGEYKSCAQVCKKVSFLQEEKWRSKTFQTFDKMMYLEYNGNEKFYSISNWKWIQKQKKQQISLDQNWELPVQFFHYEQ